jgi:hypothetical protein
MRIRFGGALETESAAMFIDFGSGYLHTRGENTLST